MTLDPHSTTRILATDGAKTQMLWKLDIVLQTCVNTQVALTHAPTVVYTAWQHQETVFSASGAPLVLAAGASAAAAPDSALDELPAGAAAASAGAALVASPAPECSASEEVQRVCQISVHP